MKVVIIGGGEVGFHVAKALSEEDYDITVVDIDPLKCRRASENLDVIVVEGNGASPKTLNDAKVGDADYVLCLTVAPKKQDPEVIDEDNNLEDLSEGRAVVDTTPSSVNTDEDEEDALSYFAKLAES